MIPFSTAYLAISAFCSPVIFEYKEHFPSCFPVTANTPKLAFQIEEEGISLHKGPFSSGKLLLAAAEDPSLHLKYLNNAILQSTNIHGKIFAVLLKTAKTTNV